MARPDLLQPVTLTAPAGFTFTQDAVVIIGGTEAVVNSVAGDGSSINLIPIPGSAGVAAVDGVTPTGTTNIVTMNTVQTVTVPPIVPLEGTEAPETAPSLTVPGSGSSFVLNDAGSFDGNPTDCCFGFHPRIYKLEIAAPVTLDFTLTPAAPGVTPSPSPKPVSTPIPVPVTPPPSPTAIVPSPSAADAGPDRPS